MKKAIGITYAFVIALRIVCWINGVNHGIGVATLDTAIMVYLLLAIIKKKHYYLSMLIVLNILMIIVLIFGIIGR